MRTIFAPANEITYELLTHVETYTHCCEASDLGLPPGHWPDQIEVSPKFGNGNVLLRGNPVVRNGELALVEYRQIGGVLRVRIFND